MSKFRGQKRERERENKESAAMRGNHLAHRHQKALRSPLRVESLHFQALPAQVTWKTSDAEFDDWDHVQNIF